MTLAIHPHEIAHLLDRFPQAQCLSLDCFDTLLWRDCHAPADLFAVLPGLTKGQRADAERRARKAGSLAGKGTEVSIAQIYARLMPNADHAVRQAAIAAELEAEARHCYAFAPTVELMRAARARHGEAVLVDWHSMPARATAGVGGARGPDVVLGDCHGSSCSVELTRRLRRAFEAVGWRVALNQPYAGGWTTQRWGRPAEGFHAIQVELNRALYFDEAAGAPGPGWGRTEKGVARVIAGLLAGT